MSKQQLETQLEQAKKDRDLALAEANNEVDRLAKLVAEEKKPKPELRHLDYGVNSDGTMFLYAKRKGDIELFGAKQGSGVVVNKPFSGHTLLGNLGDDLKAIKPLEQWNSSDGACGNDIVMDCMRQGYVWLGTRGKADWFKIGVAEEIHRKLGQVILKAKQDKG
ncbi:hypothetical protein LCGC14_0346380 [marine sediment metagenome]|uniref:Uncharacterized protein n=1 Tax=marine sediment metagenome TaxID=412755 RepID=A0A0F9VZP1_9ZZZZ